MSCSCLPESDVCSDVWIARVMTPRAHRVRVEWLIAWGEEVFVPSQIDRYAAIFKKKGKEKGDFLEVSSESDLVFGNRVSLCFKICSDCI